MSCLKKVLIIHTDGNTFNNPTLKCIIDLLVGNSVFVTIRYPVSNAPMPSTMGVKLLPWGRIYNKFKKLIYNYLTSWYFSFIIVYFEKAFIISGNYDLIIAVDRVGLIEAAHLKKITGIPFVFFSFEIMFECETSTAFKSLEKKASRDASYWFIQDEVRAKCLQRENALSFTNYSIVPLASAGIGHMRPERLRDKLGIPVEKKVAILMGSLANWSMAEDIIGSTLGWPEDWVLVVHCRYGLTHDFMKKSEMAITVPLAGKVYWSDEAPGMVDDLGYVLAGVSVGLAFYKVVGSCPYTGKNLEYLGLSSGKIATYLRYGIPVIMNNIGLYSELAKQHNFGIVLRDTEQIGGSLISINLDELSKNATNFFLAYLDFQKYKEDIWNIFNDIIKKE